MSISNKIITSVFCMIVTTACLAMERSQSLVIVEKSSPEPYTFYIPSFSDMSVSLATNWDSFRSTVTNSISDDAAFRKLGWPPTDQIACEELAKSKEIYKRVNDSIQKRIPYSTFLEDYNAINRRTLYCQRALQALSDRPDGVALAMFCMKHHQELMNAFDLSRFLLFVNEKQEKTKHGTQVVDRELSQLKIVPQDNELLNNLFKQSIPTTEEQKQKKIEKLQIVDHQKNGKK